MIYGTFKAHIKNMIKGITEGHIYKLKVCSGHFPMNVSVNKDKLIVNNFLGEKTPRELNLKEGVAVKLEGDIILVAGKGHENYQEIKGVRSHFDDKEVITEIFNK